MYEISEEAHQINGNELYPPMIQQGTKSIEPNNGEFMLRNKLLDPIVLKEFYFVYTRQGNWDDEDADATVSLLMQASKAYGIKLSKPIMVDIVVKKGERLSP